MHDIDRVLLEAGEAQELEDETTFLELGQEYEDEHEYGGHELAGAHELVGELEAPSYEHEQEDEVALEHELAEHFMALGSELELEAFVGDLFRSTLGAAQGFARSKEGRQLGGILTRAARQALPVIGQGVGRMAGGARWAPVGRDAGKLAADLFGLGPSPTRDVRPEAARRFVRTARSAIRNCARQRGTAPPRTVAQRAFATAARRSAPGLVTAPVLNAPPLGRTSNGLVRATETPTAVTPDRIALPAANRCRSCGATQPIPTSTGGRWVRRGDAIVLYLR